MQASPVRYSMARQVAAVVFAASSMLAGCGGGSDTVSTPPPPPAPPPVAAPNVTPAGGGTVVSDDGRATLKVPPGASLVSATVTLAAEASPMQPADASIVGGTSYRLGGDGGALSADAEIAINADSAFPAGFAKATSLARRTLALRTPDAPCDVDGDGDVDAADANLWTSGYQCFEPPKLVRLDAATALLGNCGSPVGTQVNCKINSLVAGLIGVQFDASAPTIAVESFDGPTKPQAITQAGVYTLRVTATDNQSVERVDFYTVSYRGNFLIRSNVASATSPPYQASIALSNADNGKIDALIAEAVDNWGNVAGRGVPLLVDIPAPPSPDTTPPTVSVIASSTTVLVGQSLTLTATASDNVGVVKIEFLKNGVKVAETASNPAALQVLAFSAADIGTINYTINAYDGAGNVGSTSANITVAPAAGEAWVHAGTGSDSNAGTSAAPFKTLAKAFTTVGDHGTVWLVGNTVITPTSEGLQGPQMMTGIAVPTGVAIKAEIADAPTIGVTLTFAAGGSVTDARFDPSTFGRVLASGGVVNLNRVRWAKLGTTNLTHGLVVSGTAKVNLGAVGQTDFAYVLSGLNVLASVADSAELTVLGGLIDGAGQVAGFSLDGTAKLKLEGTKIIKLQGAWHSSEGVIYVGGTANRVDLIGVTIDLAGGFAPCIVQDRQVAGAVVDNVILIQDSTLANCAGGGMQLREGFTGVGVFNSTISGSGRYAIEAGQVGFDSGSEYGRPEISVVGSQLTGNALGSVSFNNGGLIGLHTSSLAGGARGVVLSGDKRYTFIAYQSSISGATDAAWLGGDANSSFNLGTIAVPGGNTFNAATRLRLSVAAGVTVHAVGNTWQPNVQGADAAGLYSVAACGANPCEVTAGSGANYVFDNAGAGAKLRLAGQ